jgi:hypothetical protein
LNSKQESVVVAVDVEKKLQTLNRISKMTSTSVTGVGGVGGAVKRTNYEAELKWERCYSGGKVGVI